MCAYIRCPNQCHMRISFDIRRNSNNSNRRAIFRGYTRLNSHNASKLAKSRMLPLRPVTWTERFKNLQCSTTSVRCQQSRLLIATCVFWKRFMSPRHARRWEINANAWLLEIRSNRDINHSRSSCSLRFRCPSRRIVVCKRLHAKLTALSEE